MGLALVEVTGRYDVAGPAANWGKRTVDVLGAVLILLFFLPIGLVMIVALRLSRGGPILAREEIIGLDGAPFGRWRLHDAGDQDGPVDQLLERAGLTYLPSTINVIAGEMSLIGPEPHSPERCGHLSKARSDYRRRFEARPGMIWPKAADGAPSVNADVDYVSGWTGAVDFQVASRYAVNGMLRETRGAD